MRPIKFRAKALNDFETSIDGIKKGDWVYGYYYFCRTINIGIIVTTLSEESGGVGSGIIQVEIEVDYTTAGQFIGLEDRNGKEIYEGDIFMDEEDNSCNSVEWNIFYGGWGTNEWWLPQELVEHSKTLEVIGNIYDNPELLTN